MVLITILIKTDKISQNYSVDINSFVKDFKEICINDKTKEALFLYNERELNPEKTWFENGIRGNDIIELSFIDKNEKSQKGFFENMWGFFTEKAYAVKPSNMAMAMPRLPMNFSQNGGYTF